MEGTWRRGPAYYTIMNHPAFPLKAAQGSHYQTSPPLRALPGMAGDLSASGGSRGGRTEILPSPPILPHCIDWGDGYPHKNSSEGRRQTYHRFFRRLISSSFGWRYLRSHQGENAIRFTLNPSGYQLSFFSASPIPRFLASPLSSFSLPLSFLLCVSPLLPACSRWVCRIPGSGPPEARRASLPRPSGYQTP